MRRNAMKSRTPAALLFSLLLASAPGARAQEDYPARPVQIVAPAAGVSTDVLARIFADKFQRRMGQPMVVVNRPGAAGTIAAQAVATAAPDGYTLLMVNAAHVINTFLYPKLPFDNLRDFVGVALIAEAPFVIVVGAQLGVRTLKEFITLAKQKPGTMNYASAGFGSTTHLAGSLFATRAGIDMVHVPYQSMPGITTDFLGGRIQVGIYPPGFMLAQVRDKKLVALAVTANEPMQEPMELPTVREAAGVDYEFTSWNGVLAPAKTPPVVLEKLARAMQQIAGEEDVKEKLKAMGQNSRSILLRDFDAYMRADVDRFGPIVKASGTSATKRD